MMPPELGFVRTSFLRRPQQTRSLIAAPTPGQGPLMERRADRALPSLSSSKRLLKTLPIFLGILTASCLAIFNYQKSSSSVVNSTLYALRTNPKAREILGDEIYFAHKIPWIWGEMNQLHGRIDIKFMVKGTKNTGEMRFKSIREKRLGYVCEFPWSINSKLMMLQFSTQEWSLETPDGGKIQLLDPNGRDPFRKAPMAEEE
jgi:cytochrome c oxidase assembly factor 1